MTELEKKRLETEYFKVVAARKDLELKVMEIEEQKIKLSEHIKIQIKRENELKELVNVGL